MRSDDDDMVMWVAVLAILWCLSLLAASVSGCAYGGAATLDGGPCDTDCDAGGDR